jgi:alpha-beta hydrolase superfamily lysophospholipase
MLRTGSGDPLVLLHGLTGTWEIWQPVIDRLAAEHEVIALTLPGHHGGCALNSGASVEQLADALERRLDELGITTAHLAGNSLGGLLAVVLARRGRARSVVALSPAGGWARQRDFRRVAVQIHVSQRLLRRHGDRALQFMRRPRARRLALRGAMEHGERIPMSVLPALLDGARGCGVYGEIMAALDADGSLRAAATPPGVPVRIAWAEHDRTIGFERYGRPFLSAVPGAEHVTLPGVGHVPMYDDPELIATTILEVTRSVSDDLDIQGARGRVTIRRWGDGDPRYAVLLAHGVAEHAGRYAHVARRLVADGAVVYAPDHLGHGRSDGTRALVEDFDDLLRDFAAAESLVRGAHPDLPLVILGHSMGGLIAARHVQNAARKPQALVLSGPPIGGNPQFGALLGMDPFPDVPLDPAALSRDPSVGERYLADEDVYSGPILRPTLAAILGAADAAKAGPPFGEVPVLWLHGELDPLAPADLAEPVITALAGDGVERRVYSGAMHEVFNETNRDEVLDDLVAFIGRVLTQVPAQASPSGA